MNRIARWAVVPAILAGLTACNGPGPEGHFIVDPSAPGHSAAGAPRAQVGEPLLLLAWDAMMLAPGDDKPIHLLSAQLLGVKPGLVVDGVWGIRFSERAPTRLGATEGLDWVQRMAPFNHRATDIVLEPSCPRSAHCHYSEDGHTYQDWYLYAQLHVSRPGVYQTSGVRVTYEVDGRKYFQDMRSELIDVSTTGKTLDLPP